MRLHRFLVIDMEFLDNKIVLDDKILLNQLLRVFRMKKGSQFVVFDGSGVEFCVEIEEIEKKQIICNVLEENTGLKQNKRLTLVFSMIKKENMETILNMCTQLGVTNFIPILSERTVKTGWNYERMEKIVSEAVEQAGFSAVPQIAKEPKKLEKVLEKLKQEKENLDTLAVFDFDGVPLSSLRHLISVDTIFIGPEGGWSEKERAIFKKYKVKSISLGQNVLRAETACVAISSIFLL